MFSERLKQLRKLKKLTHEYMANLLGMTRQGYGNYENGKREPDQETLEKLADFFETSVDYLLGRTNDPGVSNQKINELTESQLPSWATKRDINDLKKYLERKENLNFDGVPIDEDEKQDLLKLLTKLFWKSKEMNKRKKPKNDTE